MVLVALSRTNRPLLLSPNWLATLGELSHSAAWMQTTYTRGGKRKGGRRWWWWFARGNETRVAKENRSTCAHVSATGTPRNRAPNTPPTHTTLEYKRAPQECVDVVHRVGVPRLAKCVGCARSRQARAAATRVPKTQGGHHQWSGLREPPTPHTHQHARSVACRKDLIAQVGHKPHL